MDDTNFSLRASGNTIVIGIRWESAINIYVCKKYQEAEAWLDESGKWEKLDNNDDDISDETPIYSYGLNNVGSICRCPVCNGKGFVDDGFYLGTGSSWISTGGTQVCRSCCGKGYVQI